MMKQDLTVLGEITVIEPSATGKIVQIRMMYPVLRPEFSNLKERNLSVPFRV